MNLPKFEFYFYAPTALFQVAGEDAATFLQGQFTNDLNGLAIREGAYGLWLNQKGRVLADSFICRMTAEKAFLLSSYFSEPSVILERLNAYVIADDVTIEEVASTWSAVSLLGPESYLPDAPETALKAPGRRSDSGSREWFFPVGGREKISAYLSEAGAIEISAPTVEMRRITAGIAAVPQDIGPGELPNEGGLEAVAISYTKGCYLGQEVMARLKSMGQIRRRLVRVAIMGDSFPSLPAALYVEGRKIGELRSAVADRAGRLIGLALISLVNLRSESAFAFAAGADPRVRLAEPFAVP